MPQVRANGIDIEYESFGRERRSRSFCSSWASPPSSSSGRRRSAKGWPRRGFGSSGSTTATSASRPISPALPAPDPRALHGGGHGGKAAGCSLHSRRHGRRRRRAHGRARRRARPYRRRLDGRHDRPTGRDQPSRPGEEPHLDHVHHRDGGTCRRGTAKRCRCCFGPPKSESRDDLIDASILVQKALVQSGLSGRAKRRCAR